MTHEKIRGKTLIFPLLKKGDVTVLDRRRVENVPYNDGDDDHHQPQTESLNRCAHSSKNTLRVASGASHHCGRKPGFDACFRRFLDPHISTPSCWRNEGRWSMWILSS